jgi:hypothetical protein
MALPDKHERVKPLQLIGDAAVEAEFESGRREETVEEAKAHLLVRIGRIAGGSVLLLVGIAGLALPVLPGWLFIIPGLGLLSFDVPFAARLLERVKDRIPQDESGHIPRRTWVIMAASFVFFASLSIWWRFLRQA